MATKVAYKQGTKKTYLGLAQKLPNALYFCTDTKELFRGDDLLSDGVRLVASFSALPQFEQAADGILYFCEDSGCGYVLNETRDAWIVVLHGADGETIEVNENGMLAVKAIPIGKVSGLEERISAVEKSILAGAPIATKGTAGIVKPGEDFAIDKDGTLSLVEIPQTKITGLEERLSNIEKTQVGGVHYKGSVKTVEDLPGDAVCGDLYEVEADNSEWCWNGEKWFEYGKTTNLSPLANAEVNEKQFEIKGKTLNIIDVDSDVVTHRNKSLRDVIDELSRSLVWEDMAEEVDPAQGAAAVVAAANDGDTVKFSAGTVQAISVDKSVTIKGAAFGLPQNFAQEV